MPSSPAQPADRTPQLAALPGERRSPARPSESLGKGFRGDPCGRPGGKGHPLTLSLATVRELRLARNEILICKGEKTAGSGIQYWGDLATGLFAEGRRKRF